MPMGPKYLKIVIALPAQITSKNAAIQGTVIQETQITIKKLSRKKARKENRQGPNQNEILSCCLTPQLSTFLMR